MSLSSAWMTPTYQWLIRYWPAAVLVGLLGSVACFRMSAWRGEEQSQSVEQMAARLADRLGLHVRAAAKDGNARTGLFLSRRQERWVRLNTLIRNPATIDEWQGVVHIEELEHELGRLQTTEWRDCCLVLEGRFVLFGEPALLEQIAAR